VNTHHSHCHWHCYLLPRYLSKLRRPMDPSLSGFLPLSRSVHRQFIHPRPSQTQFQTQNAELMQASEVQPAIGKQINTSTRGKKKPKPPVPQPSLISFSHTRTPRPFPVLLIHISPTSLHANMAHKHSPSAPHMPPAPDTALDTRHYTLRRHNTPYSHSRPG